MALSDWATFAINEKAECTNGVLEGFDGGSVEIYKNWIYVGDEKKEAE